MELYEKEPSILRRYPDSERERNDALVVRSRPLRRRDSSSDDDYERISRRKSLVLRPRSASRVRIQEPALVAYVSSSDDERRMRRRGRNDHTHIRTTSRPGKKNEYAFVRHPSRGRRKSDARAAVVHDLELKTDPRSKEFRGRRNSLQNMEAAVLVRARSRERERLVVDDDSDLDVHEGRRQRHEYEDETRHGRRAIVIAGKDDRRRSAREPKLYSYGNEVVIADDTKEHRPERRAPRVHRASLSPDRGSIDSGSVRRANTLTKPRLSRVYDDRTTDSPVLRDPRRDSAYYTNSERRTKGREREAIEREKRAIEREKVALEREQLLVDREKKAPAGVVPEERRLSTVDYLKQGDQYIKDGQKYYKTGQGAMGGVNNFFR